MWARDVQGDGFRRGVNDLPYLLTGRHQPHHAGQHQPCIEPPAVAGEVDLAPAERDAQLVTVFPDEVVDFARGLFRVTLVAKRDPAGWG
jgi:hypothetical protein